MLLFQLASNDYLIENKKAYCIEIIQHSRLEK